MKFANFSVQIKSNNGLHMRNSGALANVAKQHNARVVLIHGKTGKQASADNPLATMLLNIRCGDVVHFSVTAKDAAGLEKDIRGIFLDSRP